MCGMTMGCRSARSDTIHRVNDLIYVIALLTGALLVIAGVWVGYWICKHD